MLRDSSRVIRSEISPDRTERMLPGATYGPVCQQRVREDRDGFTLLAPLLVQDWDSNVYARDLHARDTLLLDQYPGRPVYLMKPINSEIGAALHLLALAPDSLHGAWRPGGTAVER